MDRVAHRALALQRLRQIQKKEEGYSYWAVGKLFGVSHSRVHEWHRRYVSSGRKFESLYNRGGGPKSPANTRTDIEDDLRRLWAKGHRGRALLKQLRACGHRVAMSTVYSNVHRLKLAKPRPRDRPKEKPKKIEHLLGWVQADVMYIGDKHEPVQYTAIECKSRLRFIRVYPGTSPQNSCDFIRRCLDFFRDVHVVAWQTDGGMEWLDMKPQSLRPSDHPVGHLLRERGVVHRWNIGQPHKNGKVERSHRIDREEYYGVFDRALALESFGEWLKVYNEGREHGSIGMRTPKQELERILGREVALDYSLCGKFTPRTESAQTAEKRDSPNAEG